jgi:hypothetical protein
MNITRREAILMTAAGSAALLVPGMAIAQTSPQKPPKPPALKMEIVKEFVGVSHGKFDKVKEMLGNEPALLHACFDHGGGDFETGLEAAGHIGDREIALYLIGKGARLSIFQAAMLGQLDLVKGIIALYPEARHSKGPHRLDLMHHARKGGDEARAVLEFLEKG